MAKQQPENLRADGELEPEPATVNLTADELRSLSGGSGVMLNIEIDKRPKSHGHPHERGHHGKR